jgi:hypothetical protein
MEAAPANSIEHVKPLDCNFNPSLMTNAFSNVESRYYNKHLLSIYLSMQITCLLSEELSNE